jgi:hypothetical protein
MIAVAVAALLGAAPAPGGQAPTLDELLAAAGRYVQGFERDFATVVSDETYEQRDVLTRTIGTRARTTTTTRTIRSETLFLWLPVEHEWLTVRNVRRVDRQNVPDSESRLERIFAEQGSDGVSRFKRLRDESARFNLGGIRRNVSDLAVPLRVVDPRNQPRFTFSILGRALVAGIPTWQLAFVEVAATPTMITVDGHDAPSSGVIWAMSSGIILRTQLKLSDPLSHVAVVMTVTYARDKKLAGWVPVRMDERYAQNMQGAPGDEDAPARAADDATLPTRRSLAGAPFTEQITCVATYSNFRRFETSARIIP